MTVGRCGVCGQGLPGVGEASRSEAATLPPGNGAPFSGAKSGGSEPVGAVVACVVCGGEFRKARVRAKFCSSFCKDVAHGRRER